jgi:hypothetical protein
VADAVRRGERPPTPKPYNSEEETYMRLMQACWSQDPALRPSFDKILGELRKARISLPRTFFNAGIPGYNKRR